MKTNIQKERAGTNCVSATALGTHLSSPIVKTAHQGFHYTTGGMTRRKLLLSLGGLSLLGGFSLVNLNIIVPKRAQNEPKISLRSVRTGEITFPPPQSAVPQEVHLKGHAQNIKKSEDLRVEVSNFTGKIWQYWYKPMEFREGDVIYRKKHHFGQVTKDVGHKYWVQLVIPKSGLDLNEDVYGSVQDCERIGEKIFYIRRWCRPDEVLSPETWKMEQLIKQEIKA